MTPIIRNFQPSRRKIGRDRNLRDLSKSNAWKQTGARADLCPRRNGSRVGEEVGSWTWKAVFHFTQNVIGFLDLSLKREFQCFSSSEKHCLNHHVKEMMISEGNFETYITNFLAADAIWNKALTSVRNRRERWAADVFEGIYRHEPQA